MFRKAVLSNAAGDLQVLNQLERSEWIVFLSLFKPYVLYQLIQSDVKGQTKYVFM